MKQYAEGSNYQLLQPLAELDILKQALKQEREQVALAREETESFRQQLQKLKGYVKESQNEAKEAKEKVVSLQQRLEESARIQHAQVNSQRQTTMAEAEHANYKNRLEKLAALLQEREKKIVELQQYEISFRKINEQKALHGSAIEKHLTHIRSLEDELQKASEEIQKSCQKNEEQEIVIQELHQKQEVNQSEMEALQIQFESLKKNAENFKTDLDTAANKQSQLESFLQATEMPSLDEAATQLKNMQEQLQAAEKEVADKQELQNERDSLQESLTQAKSSQEDAEARLKIAHQHLAKKVKETAQLNDQVQASQEQLLDLQGQLNLSRARIVEMQQATDAHALQESRLQEQIQQSAKSMESLASRWEEKYFKIYEKWQEAEVRIREMKKLEDKCSQMQSLLAGISGVFGVPVGSTNPPASPAASTFKDLVAAQLPTAAENNDPVLEKFTYEEESAVPGFYGQLAQPHLHSDADDMAFAIPPSENVQEENGEKTEKPTKGPYQSLFDIPQHVQRPKNTLFD